MAQIDHSVLGAAGAMTKRTLSCDNTRRKWESVLLSQIGRGSWPGAQEQLLADRGELRQPHWPHENNPTPTSDSPSFCFSFLDAISCSVWFVLKLAGRLSTGHVVSFLLTWQCASLETMLARSKSNNYHCYQAGRSCP